MMNISPTNAAWYIPQSDFDFVAELCINHSKALAKEVRLVDCLWGLGIFAP